VKGIVMTCATLTLKVQHLAVNADAGKLGNDSMQKFISDLFHKFRLLALKTRGLKENVFLDTKCGLCIPLCVLLQTDLAVVNFERIEREIRVYPRVVSVILVRF
jgi:hypothetical protein